MKLKEFDIRLDIKRSQKHDYIEVVQGDYETNILNIQITENLQPYNLTGLSVEIAFAKPDNTTVLQDGDNGVTIEDAEQGKIKVVLKTNTIAAAGKVYAEVRIKDGDMILTTARFDFFVRRAIFGDDTIKSKDEWPLYEQLLEAAENENERIDNENTRIQNETQRENQEIIRQQNEQDRTTAESARNVAESDRQTNEQSRINNESIRQQQESDRMVNEQERINAEEQRISVESERLSAENERISREQERIENENTRVANEAERQLAEQERINAENMRISNETTRQSNEQARINAELERQTNEQLRREQEDYRQASIADIENRWNQLTTAQQQDAEVINARTSTTKGKTFPSLNDRIEEIEADTHKAKTTPEIYNTASIFSVGVGTDSQGSPLDYSESIVKGQISATLKGRTVNNLMGADGDCEDISKFTATNCTLALDATNKVFGNNGIKITIATGQTQGIMSYNIFSKLNKAKYYLITAYLKKGNCTDIRLRLETDDMDIESSAVTATSFTRVGIVVQPSDIDTATSAVIQIIVNGAEGQYGYVDGIMVNEITSEEYALGAAVCMSRYNYHNSTKSTFSARVKSVGKNLFNDKITQSTADVSCQRTADYIEVSNTSGSFKFIKTAWIMVEPNTNYTLSFEGVNVSGTDAPRIRVTAEDDITGLAIKEGSGFITFNTGANKKIRLYLYASTNTNAAQTKWYSKIQIEEGTTATAYEPYKETVAYLPNITLRSLPNNVKDEINVTDRKLIKRIGEKSNIANGMEIDFADMAEGGTYYAWNDDGETETGIKGDTLGIDATTLIYQLAEPIEIPIEAEGTLEGYPGGTVYIEPYIADTFQYNSGITLPKPVTQIDKIKGFVDNWKELSNSYTLSPDGLTLTIDGITNGQYIKVYAPIKPEESTIPTTAMQFPCNLKAQVEGNMKLANKANLRIDELDDFVTAMLLNHEMRITLLEGGSL